MVRAGDDPPPTVAAPEALARISTAEVVALTGYHPGTVRDAAHDGDLRGSTKDARGRWWHDPEAVRQWARSRPMLRETPEGWTRMPYWRGKGRALADEGFHPEAWIIDPDTGCWVWQAAVTTHGHPIAWDGTRHVIVRRVLWERAHGPIPEGHRLWRTCAEGRCVNPEHLELRPPGTKPRPVPPRPPTRHQLRLGPLMPTERPEGMPAREWALLVGLLEGRTVAEMATILGVARQHGYVHLRRAEGRLRSSDR